VAEYGICPVCGRKVAVMTPRGGDGSLVVLRKHGPTSRPCAGSRGEPVPTPDPEEQRAGRRSTWDGPCNHPDCRKEDGRILRDERIIRYKEGWAHVVDMPGQDENAGPTRAQQRALVKQAKESAMTNHESDIEDTLETMGDDDAPNRWRQTVPGFVENMPNPVYHADPWHTESVSNSEAILLLDAPALFRYHRDHPRASNRSQNLGSAAHTRVLGAGDKLVKVDADSYRTGDARKAKAKALAAGQIPLLAVRAYPDKPCEWEVVDAMAEALERDPLAPYLFTAGRAEVSAFFTDTETGVPRRTRFDFLPDAKPDEPVFVFPDYKSTEASLSPAAFGRHADDFGYDMQDYTYEAALVALGYHPNPQMVFVVQSVKPPYLVAVHQLTERARENGHRRTLRALRRWLHCTHTGHWYGWEGSVHQVELPAYAYQREELAQMREPIFETPKENHEQRT
jgi:hypothetical protein